MEGIEHHLEVLVMGQHNLRCILESFVEVAGRGPVGSRGPGGR